MNELPPSAFDVFLDHRFRGVSVDSDTFIAAHPELTEGEREQVRSLCSDATDEPSSVTHPESPEHPLGELPPMASIGGFRLRHRLGSGGMGAVFLAEDEALGRQVAVKILGPDLLGTGERAERFLREVRAVARLRHPNIVTVYAAGEQEGLRYMAMEFVPGSSLSDLIAEAATRGTRLSVTDVLRWGTEIARALQSAHEAGIVHRDVKPSNIRITAEGHAVLLDFGLVLEEGAATLTEEGSFRGSPQYASPEQVGLSAVPIDRRTDIYSLGATLYEALTGIAPFRAETRDQLFNQILSREPLPLRRLDPSLPRDLETVILSTLEKEPRRRHATASALAEDLEAVRDRRPVSVRPISPFGRLARWARRQPAKAVLAATVIAAIPVVAGLGGYIAANLPKIERATADERARQLATLLEDAYLEYGEGEPVRAQSVFESALGANPRSPEARAGFALCRIEQDASKEAISFLEGPASSDAGHWSGRIRVEALRRSGNQAEADALLKAIGSPTTGLDWFVTGMIELNRFHATNNGNARAAFEHLRLAVLCSPTATPLYYYELGHAAWHGGRDKEAKEVAAAIEHLWPESPERWFAIGRALKRADPEAATNAFEKAANPPPRALNTRDNIAIYLSESGRPRAIPIAWALATEDVSRNPGGWKSHMALGNALYAKHDVGGAIREYEESIRLNPNDGTNHRKLAEAFLTLKDFEHTIEPARASVRLNSKDAPAWNFLGVALLQRGDVDGAINSFEASLEVEPNDPNTLCNLGSALLKRGEFAKGLEQLRKGDEKGSTTSQWKYPSKQWVAQAQRLVALERRLDHVHLEQGGLPTLAEKVAFAHEICGPTKHFSEAVQFYADAFQIDSTLMSQRTPHYLLDASVAALSAGAGSGVDAPADQGGRSLLRDRARAWFKEEVESSEETLRGDAAQAVAIRDLLLEWKAQPALVVTRDPGFESGTTRNAEWGRLWARFDALVAATETRLSR